MKFWPKTNKLFSFHHFISSQARKVKLWIMIDPLAGERGRGKLNFEPRSKRVESFCPRRGTCVTDSRRSTAPPFQWSASPRDISARFQAATAARCKVPSIKCKVVLDRYGPRGRQTLLGPPTTSTWFSLTQFNFASSFVKQKRLIACFESWQSKRVSCFKENYFPLKRR